MDNAKPTRLLCCPAITANEAVKRMMYHLQHPAGFTHSAFSPLNDLFFNDTLSQTGINPDGRFCLHVLAVRYVVE